MKKKDIIISLVTLLMITVSSCSEQKTDLDKLCKQLKFKYPKHGFVGNKPAWRYLASAAQASSDVGVSSQRLVGL